LAEPTKLTNLQNAPCGIEEDRIPLCVDLDGTLIKTDVLWESVLRLLIRNPLCVFVLPLWVIRGKASLKWHVAQHIQLDITSLPYRKDLLLLLQEELARGRYLVLATACHSSQAQRIAAHLNLFTEVIATEKLNLRSAPKRAAWSSDLDIGLSIMPAAPTRMCRSGAKHGRQSLWENKTHRYGRV